MKCEGVFIFKSVNEKDGGEFTNTMGQVIKYNGSYEVKFDDFDKETNEVNERKVKVSLEQALLIEKLKQLKMYQQVKFIFEVGFNTKGVTLKLVDIELISKN